MNEISYKNKTRSCDNNFYRELKIYNNKSERQLAKILIFLEEVNFHVMCTLMN